LVAQDIRVDDSPSQRKMKIEKKHSEPGFFFPAMVTPLAKMEVTGHHGQPSSFFQFFLKIILFYYF
jgi:hypothetical protein